MLLIPPNPHQKPRSLPERGFFSHTPLKIPTILTIPVFAEIRTYTGSLTLCNQTRPLPKSSPPIYGNTKRHGHHNPTKKHAEPSTHPHPLPSHHRRSHFCPHTHRHPHKHPRTPASKARFRLPPHRPPDQNRSLFHHHHQPPHTSHQPNPIFSHHHFHPPPPQRIPAIHLSLNHSKKGKSHNGIPQPGQNLSSASRSSYPQLVQKRGPKSSAVTTRIPHS